MSLILSIVRDATGDVVVVVANVVMMPANLPTPGSQALCLLQMLNGNRTPDAQRTPADEVVKPGDRRPIHPDKRVRNHQRFCNALHKISISYRPELCAPDLTAMRHPPADNGHQVPHDLHRHAYAI